MDRLSALFDRFSLSADVFYTGALCGICDFANDQGIGILHVLRRGSVRVLGEGNAPWELSEPTLFFYQQSHAHRFEVDEAAGADLVCAFIDFGAGMGTQILRGLPPKILLPMQQIPGAQAALELLFDEAFAERSGRTAGIGRLVEFFAILLTRHAVDAKLVKAGVLAGLADERLAAPLMAMQSQPERDWSLEGLAALAAMSRARFAAHFRATVGATPLDYLTDWRISTAQQLLRRGKPLKSVAAAVGYASDAAFARVFARRVGLSPKAWLTH